MKILVTGPNGQLGRELSERGKAAGFRICAPERSELDITRPDQIQSVADTFRPALIVNAAAYTQVDRAESEPGLCRAVNRDGPLHLSRCCQKAKIPLIHVSTDFVFDGNKTSPYTEDDPPAPIGVYGRTKFDGEEAVRNILAEHLIVRTAWFYSARGHNFVRTMLRLGTERDELGVVDDQFGSPTCAADLGVAILTIAKMLAKNADIPWGTYHYCGKGVTSWHGFARKIFEIASRFHEFKVKRINALTTAQYPTVAARPAYSALDCRKITENLGIRPVAWQASLEKTISRIYAT